MPLLDALPTLADALSGEAREWAEEHLELPILELDSGIWHWQATPEPAGLAGIVTTGLLAHRVTVGVHVGNDLLGPCHVVCPWRTEERVSVVAQEHEWRALSRTRIALLDEAYLGALGDIPEIAPALTAVTVDYASMVACRMAILSQPHVADRLILLLWHMAERWGRVTSDGVRLELPGLTQALLSETIGSSRQSVNLALAQLRRLDLVETETGSSWLLAGSAEPAIDALVRDREAARA